MPQWMADLCELVLTFTGLVLVAASVPPHQRRPLPSPSPRRSLIPLAQPLEATQVIPMLLVVVAALGRVEARQTPLTKVATLRGRGEAGQHQPRPFMSLAPRL